MGKCVISNNVVDRGICWWCTLQVFYKECN